MIRRTIYLKRADDGAVLRCCPDGDAAASREEIFRNGPWESTGLSRNTVYDDERRTTFGDLFTKWARIDGLEEIETEIRLDTQRRIGRILYNGLFGSKAAIGDRWVHLVPLITPGPDPISPPDSEFLDLVCHLPWSFLTTANGERADFLVRAKAGPGIVTIDAWPERDNDSMFETKLPPFPTILAVIPTNSEGGDETHGTEHWEAIRRTLEPHYAGRKLTKSLVCVRTFEEFTTAVQDARPHLIYLYGHAHPEKGSTGFWFDKEDGTGDFINVDEIQQALHDLFALTRFAPVVWVNACQGSSAERHNFLRQLSPLAAAVVTTRTLAAVEDSRAIAERALPAIAIGGRPPHGAIRDILAVRAPPVLSARWATTVISVQYELWSALDPEQREVEDIESAGDFPMRMDRNASLAKIAADLSARFAAPPEAQLALPHVVIWKGPAEQSLDVFTRRFVDHVSEQFPAWTTIEFRVDPQVDARPADSLDHDLACILIALLGRELDPGELTNVDYNRINNEVRRICSGRRSILLFIHGPFTRSNVAAIGDYINNWRALHTALEHAGDDFQVVLGFAFDDEEVVVAAPPPTWEGVMIAPLEAVEPRELSEHLKKFRRFYNLAPDQAGALAQQLVEDACGLFRPIHAKLEQRAKFIRWSRRSANPGGSNG
jgi:hypothetical protein